MPLHVDDTWRRPGSSGAVWMPRTNAAAYTDVWMGSSDGTSSTRPQRTSRTRLSTGVQNVSQPAPAFRHALASRPMCAAVADHRLSLKLAPVVMGRAKFIVLCPLQLAPCVASFHH